MANHLTPFPSVPPMPFMPTPSLNEELHKTIRSVVESTIIDVMDKPGDKLGEIIKKQQAMYEDLLAKMANEGSGNYNDDIAVDSELANDESDSDKEAENTGTDTDDNGDTNIDSGFDILI